MLKYLGIAAIFTACVLPAFEYSRRVERRGAEYSCFIGLADAIRREVSTYMRPIGSFLSEFKCPLSHLGLKFTGGCDFLSDFEKIEDKLLVSDAAREELHEFFRTLGTAARDEEIRRASRLREILEKELEKGGTAADKSVGAVRAICCALGLAFVILLI